MADKPAFLTWEEGDEKGKQKALAGALEGLKRVQPVVRRTGNAVGLDGGFATGSNIFYNVAPLNTSVRDDFSRYDYENFRRDQILPTDPKEIIRACMGAYKKFGLVRNIIDLMGDFSVQGIDLAHPNERIEKFYKEWFRQVRGRNRSERFLSVLYRGGLVVVTRDTGRLYAKDEQALKRAQGADGPDLKIADTLPQAPPFREIPWRYSIKNPLSLALLSEELAPLIGEAGFLYGVKVPTNIVRVLKNPRNASEKSLVQLLPRDVVRSLLNGNGHGPQVVPLDPLKTRAFFYKKDDWQAWPEPMLAPLLVDLQILDKMKLADTAALDGAISNIRLWKLGNLEARILPSEATILRLAEMLTNNVGGGVMDLIWGPEIELVESRSEVYKFLGSSKYEPILNFIYQGLGVPQSLTGTSKDGGFTNNFVSLKTLIERLEYGREVLRAFWEEEIRLVQLAMGFRFPATLVYDRMTLNDEAAEKQLLLNLADRLKVSDETLQEKFDLVPEVERVRIRREERKRRDGLTPPQASPFHDPQKDEQVRKILAQSGAYNPSELGHDLAPRKPGEKSPVEVQAKHAPKPAPSSPTKVGVGGRPKQSRDQRKRKKRTVKPRTSVKGFTANFLTASLRHEEVSRELAGAPGEGTPEFALLKFRLLFCGAPISPSLLCDLPRAPEVAEALYQKALSSWSSQNGSPTTEVADLLARSVYALLLEKNDGQGNG